MSHERRKQASKTIINRLFRILQILCNMLNLYENAHGFMQYKKWQWSVHGPSPCSPGAWSNKNVRFMCFPPNFNIAFLVKYRVKNNDILSVRVACCNEVKTMKISLKRTPFQSFIHHYLLDKINGISRIRFVKKQDCVYISFSIFASEFLCFCHFFFNILIRSTAMNLHKITTRIMSKYFCMHGFYT